MSSTPAAQTPGAPVAPQPAGSPLAASSALSVTSLVLGLSSLVFGFTFLVPIAAVVVGILALPREPASRALSIWGIVLGSVMLLGIAIAIILGIALFIPLGLAGLLAV